MDLFSDGKPEPDLPPGADFYPNFLDKDQADFLFEHLINHVPWNQEEINFMGNIHPVPRLTYWYSKENKEYVYSGIKVLPVPYTKVIQRLSDRVEEKSGYKFNSVLLNQYRDGNDSNGWHADNEKELGKNPPIASVSFGSDRFFHLKHREKKELRFKILLKSGSLFFMEGETQTHWLHQIAKTSQPVGTRINLTFRRII